MTIYSYIVKTQFNFDMGVSGIARIFKPFITPISKSVFRDKFLAIDANNIVFRYASVNTNLTDNEGRPTGHYQLLINLVLKLKKNNITPIFVFDSKRCDGKIVRPELKEDVWNRVGYALQSSREFLEDWGVYTISHDCKEAEQVAASLCVNGFTICGVKHYATGVYTYDYDVLLFGAPIMINEIKGEKMMGYTTRDDLGVPHIPYNISDLVVGAIHLGTDFNTGGTRGIGPVRIENWLRAKRGDDVKVAELPELTPQQREIYDKFTEVLPVYDLKQPVKNIPKIQSKLRALGFSERNVNLID